MWYRCGRKVANFERCVCVCVCVCVAEMHNKDGEREIVNNFLMLFLFFKHQVSGSI